MGIFTLDVSRLGGNEIAVLETPITGRGRTVQLQLVVNASDSNVEVYGYGLRYRPAERRAMSPGASAGLMLATESAALTEIAVGARGRTMQVSVRLTASAANIELHGIGLRFRATERRPLDSPL